MAATYTIAERDAIKKAYTSGLLTVEYDGRRKTYQSSEDLFKTLQVIESSLASDPIHGRIGTVFIEFCKG
jgi:hypothetical protein